MTRLERDRAAALEARKASQAAIKRENAKTVHTPGPWSVEPIDYGCFDVKCECGYFIATCHDGVRGDRNADVNARLIAEAPMLLEALQEMVAGDAEAIEEAQALGVPFPEEMLAVFKKARAAIARATGEQP